MPQSDRRWQHAPVIVQQIEREGGRERKRHEPTLQAGVEEDGGEVGRPPGTTRASEPPVRAPRPRAPRRGHEGGERQVTESGGGGRVCNT